MILSPDQSNQVDGSLRKHILNHLPELPVDIVPISYFPNFVFKQPPTSRYALADFLEPHSANEEYNKFWSWVIHNPPILTFRRELLKRDVSPALRPIEWAAHLPHPPLSERATFDSRPIDVLFVWGYSNASRPKLHGEIMAGMGSKGLQVVDNWQDIHRFNKNDWATIYSPHWRRKPLSELIPVMQQAKITVSMPGNGQKTFRDTECVGTLMAIQRSDIAYSYPWDESNSIQLIPSDEFNCLLEATKRDNLYDLYVACDQNMRRYQAKTYARDYVLSEIEKAL